MGRYELRGVLTNKGKHADFFFATWANGECYFGPRLDTPGDYLRRSVHRSGLHLVHEPRDNTELMSDVRATQQTRHLGQQAPLRQWKGAREVLVTLPAIHQLKWREGVPKSGSRRTVAAMDISELPDPPMWAFRFWLIEQGLADEVDMVLSERPTLGTPALISECQPMMLGFFMGADELVVRTWMEEVRATKEPGGLVIYTGP